MIANGRRMTRKNMNVLNGRVSSFVICGHVETPYVDLYKRLPHTHTIKKKKISRLPIITIYTFNFATRVSSSNPHPSYSFFLLFLFLHTDRHGKKSKHC